MQRQVDHRQAFAGSRILFTCPLQLLAYAAAVFKGTDVDQPRNLAKAATVEQVEFEENKD